MKSLADYLDKRVRNSEVDPIKEIDIHTPAMELLKRFCVPPLGAEYNFPDLFGKYGRPCTIAGAYCGWYWAEDKLAKAEEVELWKMIAIASLYWEKFYEDLV